MFNFFSKNKCIDERYYLDGNDYNHIVNVLRFKVGEKFLVSFDGKSDLCSLESFSDNQVVCKVEQENYNDTSLPISIYLFQGLIKGDKMDFVVQKAVELGVDCIVPVQMARSIVKLDDKKKVERQKRLGAIALSAAKQSKRNAVPEVYNVLNFNQAVDFAKASLDCILVPYECHNGMQSTLSALKGLKAGSKVGIFIGPEGGFEQKEIDLITNNGGVTISLGKRILRAETASLTALSMCMLYAETMLGE